MEDFKLTEHFSFYELTKTDQESFQEINRTSALNDEDIMDNLKMIAALLEQVRTIVGEPIKINSGYRCTALNKAIGGSSTSQHKIGLAADFVLYNTGIKRLPEIFKKIKDSKIPVGQVILEDGNGDGIPTWIHISVYTTKIANQFLKFNGKTYSRA